MEKEEFDFTKLTEKQRIFCHEYIVDWNATRSAKAAGYSEKTAYSIGNENLKKPEIDAYINHIQKDLAKEAGLSKLRVTRELMNLAFSSVASLKDNWMTVKEFNDLSDAQKACLSYIEHSTTKFDGGDKEVVKFRLHDKTKALEMLNKMYGYNEPDKIDHASSDGSMTPRISISNNDKDIDLG